MADEVTITNLKASTARKTPATPTPSKSRVSKAASTSEKKRKTKTTAVATQGSSASGQKRKIKTETVSPNNAAPGGQADDAAPAKKAKVEHEKTTDAARQSFLPSNSQHHFNQPTTAEILLEPRIQNFSLPQQQSSPQPFFGTHQQQQSFFHMPQQQQQQSQQHMPSQLNTQNNAQFGGSSGANQSVFDQLILKTFQENPKIFTQFTSKAGTSAEIDQFAYRLWSRCLSTRNGMLLNLAAKYSAMLGDSKLRTLAMLNYLPSWWFLREKLKRWLSSRGIAIDDSTMETNFKIAINYSATISASKDRVKAQGEKATTTGEAGDDAGTG